MGDRVRGLGEDHIIEVRDLHEVFRVYTERPPGLKDRLFRLQRAKFHDFAALEGVTFHVRHGERVGLIGHNGSGKSTLLKCLAGILPPDRGSVTVRGRVATMIELGAGFAPELTGRENMYLNGSILGIRRAEIDANFDAIVDFAGVRDFIDTPVKNYSSGMYVRLGFAIAVHVNPDVLLVDEVLAVGDQAFQTKSLARMEAFAEAGKTVVLVSHDTDAIRRLCDRVLVLEHGRVLFDGPPQQGLFVYERRVAEQRGGPSLTPLPELLRAAGEVGAAETGADQAGEESEGGDGDHAVVVSDVSLTVDGVEVDGEGRADGRATPPHTPAQLDVTVRAAEQVVGAGGLYVRFVLRRPDLAAPVYDSRTSWRVTYVAPPPPGGQLRCTVAFRLNVLTGTYLVDVEVGNAETEVVHHRLADAAKVVVEADPWDLGVAPLDVRFSLDNPDGVWPPDSEPPPLDEGGPAVHPSPHWPLGSEPPVTHP